MKNLLLLTAWSFGSVAVFGAGWFLGRSAGSPSDLAMEAPSLSAGESAQPGPSIPEVSRLALLEQALQLTGRLELQGMTAKTVWEMNVEEVEASIEALLRRKPDPDTIRTLAHLWRRFGELDGPRALDQAKALPSSTRRLGAINSALRGITWSDAEAGWEAGLAHESLRPVAEILLEKGQIEFLLHRLVAMPEGAQKTMVSSLTASQLSRSEPESFLPILESLPSGPSRNQFLMGFAMQWAQVDPVGAMQWSAALDPAEWRAVGPQLVGTYSLNNPEAAGAWLASQAPHPAFDSNRMFVISRLAARDPELALQMEEQIVDPTMRRYGRQSIVRAVLETDPLAAAQLAEAAAPEDRTEVLRTLVFAWSSRDSEQALQYVRTSPNLSSEERSSLDSLLQSRSREQ